MIDPIGKRIITKQVEPKQSTESGIILPEQEKKNHYEVVSGQIEGIKIGDIIIPKQFTGTSVEIGDEKYTIFEEQDLLAKLK